MILIYGNIFYTKLIPYESNWRNENPNSRGWMSIQQPNFNAKHEIQMYRTKLLKNIEFCPKPLNASIATSSEMFIIIYYKT